MGALLATSWSWLPSVRLGSAVSLAGAAVFVVWLFVDCSFSKVANMAGQDLRLRFLHDVYLRWLAPTGVLRSSLRSLRDSRRPERSGDTDGAHSACPRGCP